MRLTPEEFDAITGYDKRYRYELIRDVVIVNPLSREPEAEQNDELGYLLRLYRHEHPEGWMLDGTLPERYVRTHDSWRLADRVIWAGLGRRPKPKVDVPTIAVEFVSKGKRNQQRDYEEKRKDYLAAGVLEYWLIDRFRRIMTVYRNRPGQPAEQVVQEAETYRTDLLPGFELPLARLLAVADEWRPGERS
jgi:Uma2 family endonuclease